MSDADNGGTQKPATAARIYDYHLGGTHNFAADRAAAKAITEMFPQVPALAQTGRAFLRRAVHYLAGAGVRQFLDIGSGLPTEGNVHEIAQQTVPDYRVVYVDIDPVAVAESLEILEGNDQATALRADVRGARSILDHPKVRGLLDFDQPVGLLLVAVLHFVPDDAEAYGAVNELVGALAPGSYVVLSHATEETSDVDPDGIKTLHDVYKRQTATPLKLRKRPEIARFFDGLEMVDPGLVWPPQWRPEPGDPADFVNEPARSAGLVGVAKVI